MLITAHLDNNLWGAAILTANYLRNISPSSVLNNKSPYEALHKKLPSIAHLRVFGCKAYPLKVNNKGDKFDEVARNNCILIGYGDKEGIYWILDQETNKAFRSRDVKFNEIFEETTNLDISVLNENVNENDNENENVIENGNENDNQNPNGNGNENVIENGNENDNQNPNGNGNENVIENINKNDNENASENTVENKNDNSNNNNYGSSSDESIEKQQISSKRVRKQVIKYDANKQETSQQKTSNKKQVNWLLSVVDEEEPRTFREAMNSKLKERWKEAIESEFSSLKENKTWMVSELPNGKKTIKTRWVFRIKLNERNEPERFKARLVVKGYNQEYGIDYNETFAPVIKQQALKLFLAIAVNEGLEVHHADISTAFLNGDLEEEVYIDVPEGFDEKLKSNQVLRLLKALYGLKQAPRAWSKKLVTTLKYMGLNQCKADNCIFFNKSLVIAVYVDDLLIASNIREIELFKKQLSSSFKMRDLGKINYMLGIKFEYAINGTMLLNQKHFINKLIEEFNLQLSKENDIPIQPNHNLTRDLTNEKESLRELVDATKYRQVIGKLLYLMTCTRPDISYAVGLLARFMQEPRELHWRCVKRVLKYLNATQDYNLVFTKCKTSEINLTGFTDSDYAGCIEDRKSTSGYIFKYGECVVSWKSFKQKTVSLSSTESEYIGLVAAAKEALWLKHILIELGRIPNTIEINCDNQSTICIAKNPELHARSKHIDVRYHFIREKIENQEFVVKYQPSEELVADVLTKGLPRNKHYKCVEMLQLKN
jgi:hypothetical protein